MPGSPAPWPRSSPCGLRATSVPRRGVCRFRRTSSGAMPRIHSGLSGSLGPFPLPKPTDSASSAVWSLPAASLMAPVLGKRPNKLTLYADVLCPLNRGNLTLLSSVSTDEPIAETKAPGSWNPLACCRTLLITELVGKLSPPLTACAFILAGAVSNTATERTTVV
jgi:hypothetical protein